MNVHGHCLFKRLSDRYVVYGEWLYARHTIFYDLLPHYFLEFDVLDQERAVFLSTPARRELLRGLPIVSVPVLWRGLARNLSDLRALIAPSLYKSKAWRNSLREAAQEGEAARWGHVERILQETDPSDESEGLYIKVEEADQVVDRCKFVRASFLTAVLDSGSHWLDRPIVQNRLAPAVDIFSP